MIEILVYAAIAAFFFFQYRRVLGQRPDDVPQPRPLKKVPQAMDDGKVITLHPASVRSATGKGDSPAAVLELPTSLSGMLSRIQHLDGRFSEKAFLTGARKAFARILELYAAGDADGLASLVAEPAFSEFRHGIEKRAAAGHTLKITLQDIKDADITKAALEDSIAVLEVVFISEETRVLYDAAGSLLEGHEEEQEEVRDSWVFERNMAANDSRWYLIKTRSMD